MTHKETSTGSAELEIYHPFNGFDGPDHALKLKPTSKIYVREVCDVNAKRIALTDRDRCEYADQAGYKRHRGAKLANGKFATIYELFDVLDEYHFHAALCEVLFYDCPKLIDIKESTTTVQVPDPDSSEKGATKEEQVTDYTITVVDEDLFNALDEGVVNEAFLSFMSARSGIRSARSGFLKTSATTRPGM